MSEYLIGQLANSLTSPVQLSQAQQGLFGQLGAGLYTAPPVDMQNAQALQQAAAKAASQGDIQTATFYQTQLEKMKAQRDQLQPVDVNAARNEKNAAAARQTAAQAQARQAKQLEMEKKTQEAADWEPTRRWLDVLAQDLQSAGDNGASKVIRAYSAQGKMPPSSVIERANKTLGMTQTDSGSSVGKIVQDKYNLRPGDKGYMEAFEREQNIATEQKIREKSAGKTPDLVTTADVIKASPSPSDRLDKATIAAQELAALRSATASGSAFDDSALRRTVGALYPQDLKSTAGMQEFISNKSLGRRVQDWVSSGITGDFTQASIADLTKMAEVALEWETKSYRQGVVDQVMINKPNMPEREIHRTATVTGAKAYGPVDGKWLYVYPDAMTGEYLDPETMTEGELANALQNNPNIFEVK